MLSELTPSQLTIILLPVMILPGFTIFCRKKDKPLSPQPSDKSKKSSDSSKVSGLVKSSDESATLAEDSTQLSGETSLPPVDTKSSQSRTNVQSSSFANSNTIVPPLRIEPTQADGTESTQLGTEHADETDMNVFVLKAAKKHTVVHPSYVTKKGNIDRTLFHGRNKAEIEAEMATDRESDRDKSKEAVKKPGASDPKVKWGDSKCVVFETTEEPTLDDDEVQEEPDLW